MILTHNKMKKAKLILDNLSGFQGHAALYKLSEPLELYDYVICSTAIAIFSGVETYIFAANEKGEIIDWCELKGSERGCHSHAKVLANIGYEITKK